MADLSMSEQALAVLDEALREADPIARMMLIEQALKLHRQALAARDAAAASVPAARVDPLRRTER